MPEVIEVECAGGWASGGERELTALVTVEDPVAGPDLGGEAVVVVVERTGVGYGIFAPPIFHGTTFSEP